MNIRTKLIGTIVLGAALMVPVAQAQRPDDQAGPRGPGAFASAQTSSASHPDNRGGIHGPGAFEGQAAGVRPDDRAGLRGPGAVEAPEPSTAIRPDDRAVRYGPGYETTVGADAGQAYRGMLPSDYGFGNVLTAAEPESQPGGFDWGDGLIGGLSGAGLALLLTGSAFLLLSLRNRVRTA